MKVEKQEANKELSPISDSNSDASPKKAVITQKGKKAITRVPTVTTASASIKNQEPTVIIDKPLKQTVAPSAAEEIWNIIKVRDLGLFGLPNQTVEKYCTPLDLDPLKCFLQYKVSSVVPALESVAFDFNFEVSGNYLVLSKK